MAISRRAPSTSRKSQFCSAKLAPRAATLPGRPTKVGIVRRHEVSGTPGGHSRNVEQLAQFRELLFGAGETGAVAGEQQRPRRLLQLLDHARNLLLQVRVGDGSLVLTGVEAAQRRRFGNRRGLHVQWDIHPDRAGAAIHREVDGLFKFIANLEGSRTTTAYLVIGLTMETMSTS